MRKQITDLGSPASQQTLWKMSRTWRAQGSLRPTCRWRCYLVRSLWKWNRCPRPLYEQVMEKRAKLIYVTRNPRDAVVSYFNHWKEHKISISILFVFVSPIQGLLTQGAFPNSHLPSCFSPGDGWIHWYSVYSGGCLHWWLWTLAATSKQKSFYFRCCWVLLPFPAACTVLLERETWGEYTLPHFRRDEVWPCWRGGQGGHLSGQESHSEAGFFMGLQIW